MTRFRQALFPLVGSAMLGACSAPSPTVTPELAGAKVSGSVVLASREVAPPGAVLKVQLVDVSRADAAALVLGEQRLEVSGKPPPWSFEIAYDPARIDPRYSYAVQARLEVNGQLHAINDQRHAVITRGAGQRVDLVLRSVGGRP